VRPPREQTRGRSAASGVYELRWDAERYTDDPREFRGFFLGASYVEEGSRIRSARKNIPLLFFDEIVRHENRAVIRLVGTLLWFSIDWGKGGERLQTVRKSLRELQVLTRLSSSSLTRAIAEAFRAATSSGSSPGSLTSAAGGRVRLRLWRALAEC